MATYYSEVTVIGSCQGEEIVNVLWYYLPTATGTPLDVAGHMGVAWSGQVMARFAAAASLLYTLDAFDVSIYDVEWVPQLAAPQRFTAGLAGSVGGSLMGQSPVAVINFALDYSYANVAPGHGPVKRSYIAYGPLVETAVNNDHRINVGGWGNAAVSDLLACLQEELVLGPLGYQGVPIRAGSTKFINNGGEDPFHRRSWAKIAGASLRPVSSNRDSRTPTS